MTAFDCYVKVRTFGSAFNQDCISVGERSLFKQVCLRNFKCSGRCRGVLLKLLFVPHISLLIPIIRAQQTQEEDCNQLTNPSPPLYQREIRNGL